MEIYILIIVILCVIIFVLTGKIRSLSQSEVISEKQESIKTYPQLILTENFEKILRAITEGIIILDRRGNIIFANKRFKELIKTEESPEGRHFMEVIRNIDLLNLLKASTSQTKEVSEELVIKRGGDEIFLLVKAMPVIGQNGEISFLIVLLHDITRIKRLENIRKDFVANVSHELKTPITAIKGYAETLLEGAIEEDENARKFIAIIKNQADRLSSLIDDLLTLSRIESGEIKLDRELVSLNDLVNSVFQILNDQAQKRGISLEAELQGKISIYADRNKLTQILLNLIDNGIKFTEKGSVKIKFNRNSEGFVLSIVDTGIGIPKEHLPRIGERFYRVDKARSRQLGGTGLGLAIVKNLVIAHGWNLKIESEVGVGTKVNIFIPEKDVVMS